MKFFGEKCCNLERWEKLKRKYSEKERKCMLWVSKGFPIWALGGSVLGRVASAAGSVAGTRGRQRTVGIVEISGEIAGLLLLLRGGMGRIRVRVRFFLAAKLTLFWSNNCKLLQNLRFSSSRFLSATHMISDNRNQNSRIVSGFVHCKSWRNGFDKIICDYELILAARITKKLLEYAIHWDRLRKRSRCCVFADWLKRQWQRRGLRYLIWMPNS